ncbi:hypothetical protein FJU31_06105 [Stenotrophomonas cyclobalanopsidis]|uniref:Uncharacterized protein n=1 Tax=Stenotrophomonas cyclobalanopsidis TaxID=2771362 RepID=A0ABQ6T3D4_9GAMM|nr:hypothetical protein [Stenotrophomonas cyclobalanopsidis]KAA9001525.1 hypothetical protein FJU31_06105 [Stenotrophomonas cyclobalanopsidis]
MPKLYPWVIVLAALLLSAAYLVRFHAYPFGDPDSWGQFGDFLGGMLNPLVGIVTVLLVLETLRVTRQEAADNRAALEHQRAEMARQTIHVAEQAESAKAQQQSFLAQLDDARDREALREVEKHLDTLSMELSESLQATTTRRLSYRKANSGGSFFSPMTRKAEAVSKLDRAEVQNVRQQPKIWPATTESTADTIYLAQELDKWESEFGHAIELVKDIATYCDLYAARKGASKLSLYHYKHRAHPAAEALASLGLIDEAIVTSLAPGSVPKPERPEESSTGAGKSPPTDRRAR